jgi:hypothetical protein
LAPLRWDARDVKRLHHVVTHALDLDEHRDMTRIHPI